MQFNANFPPPARQLGADPVHAEVSQMGVQLARSGNAEALAHLLEAGLPPDLADEDGETLLVLACEHGHREAAAVLLEHGADPQRAGASGLTPLAAAAAGGDAVLMTLLLEHGASRVEH